MTDELVRACAWCEAEKPESERLTGDNVTHGCCPRHQRNLLIIEPLRRIATRIRTAEWYTGRDDRQEIAHDIDTVIGRLERLAR